MGQVFHLKFSIAIVLFAIALVFRLPDLGDRPFHGDEANQAMKTGILLETGRYEYDPHEHHGPTLYYGELPLLRMLGVSSIDEAREWKFRLLPVLAGSALILLLPLIPGLTALEMGMAGLFIASSNAMVFYSRYFIQEMLLVFVALLAVAVLMRWRGNPGWKWAVTFGLALGLMHATKETSVVLGAGMGFALVVAWLLDLRSSSLPALTRRSAINYGLLAFVVAAATSVVLFSAFFTHWRGPLDSILTYATYLGRAEGEGSTALHDKPWYYYLQLLAYTHRMEGPRWTEGLALGLGCISAMRIVLIRESGIRAFALRFLLVYTIFVFAVYSFIPYKTPWNLLPFWQPWLVLAGIGAAWPLTAQQLPRMARVAMAILLAVGMLHAARQTYYGNVVYAADTRNPYVYAHTSTALLRLTQRLDDLAAVSPKGKELHINVLKPDADYWPLPWYLRAYPNVGYWTQPPENADADVIIADSKLGAFVEQHTEAEYQFEFHGLRPDVKLLVYIRKPLWDAFMETRR